MAYAQLARQFLQDTAERELNSLLSAWQERHGQITFQHRESRLKEGRTRNGFKTSHLVEILDVSFEDSKAARLERADHGSWKVIRDPDTKPAPVDPSDPMLSSPCVMKEAPNLLDSLRRYTQDPSDDAA
jgi:hypothetical protein